MYIPPAFKEDDLATLQALMEAYAFATLVSAGPAGAVATHVPFMLDRTRGPHGTLVAHLARANPHGRALDGADVLVIFLGPHGYISPSWYETHPAVPTWNYAAVHAYGRAHLVHDPKKLREVVDRLTETYESARTPPWTTDGLPQPFVDGMIKGIVGIEVEIARLEGKLKLSQNRSAADRRNVIAALSASEHADDRTLAEFMTRHAAPKTTP